MVKGADPARTSGRTAARTTAILVVTIELLAEVGYEQLTIDAVAARAAASKTTIYRRWPDKRTLVCAALLAGGDAHPRLRSDAANLREDLLGLIGLMAGLAATENATAFASILAAAQKDDVIAEVVHTTALEKRRADCRDVVQRAIGRGELHEPGLVTVLFELALGQVLVRGLLQRDGFDEVRQVAFVDTVLLPVLLGGTPQDNTQNADTPTEGS